MSVPKQVWPGRQNTVFQESKKERAIRVNENIAGFPQEPEMLMND